MRSAWSHQVILHTLMVTSELILGQLFGFPLMGFTGVSECEI